MSDATSKFGSQPTLIRAEARTYFHGGNYSKHLELIEKIVDIYQTDNDVEQSYLRRECAISQARVNDWARAADYFFEASKRASNVPDGMMEVFAIGLLADAAVAEWKNKEFQAALTNISAALKRLKKIDPTCGLREMALHRIVRHTCLWMQQESELDTNFKAEFRAEIVAGANSNPSPHEELALGVLGVLETAWYLLEQAEQGKGVNAGITDFLTNELDSKLIVTGQEIMRVRMAWRSAFKKGDGRELQRLTLPKLEAQHMIMTIGKEDILGDLSNPVRGPVKSISDAEFESQRRETQLSVFGFIGYCGVNGKHAEIGDFLSADLASERPLFSNEEAAIIVSADYNQNDGHTAMLLSLIHI